MLQTRTSNNGTSYIRLDASNCIWIHYDRRRFSRARDLQEFPKPLLIRPFRRAFHSFQVSSSIFSFFWLCSAARGNRPLRGHVSRRHFPDVSDGSHFFWTRLVDLTGHSTSYQQSRWSGRCSLIFFWHVTSRQFRSGCIPLQVSRMSRPLDVILTICQCGQCVSFSIQPCRRATARRGVVRCLKN